MKKSISRTLAHIDVAANTSVRIHEDFFNTHRPVTNGYLRIRESPGRRRTPILHEIGIRIPLTIADWPASKYDDRERSLKVHISRRTAHRLLAVLVAVAVLSFGLQAAGHWHSRTFEDQHCRVCHFAHSVTVDFSHGNALPLPEVVNRLAVKLSIEPALDVVVHCLSSRGPPSA